jgi:pimeloyl-ACP methyl ester carboxylesterase
VEVPERHGQPEGPKIRLSVVHLLQALDTSPAAIPTKHPKTGAEVTWPLTGQDLLGKLLNAFNASTISLLPLLISGMAAGDFTILKGSLPLWAEQSGSYAEALVMAGQFDITTPPPLAMEVQHNLSNSFLFEFPATGHVVLGECALKLMGAFLEDPSARPDDTCVKELKLSFVTP